VSHPDNLRLRMTGFDELHVEDVRSRFAWLEPCPYPLCRCKIEPAACVFIAFEPAGDRWLGMGASFEPQEDLAERMADEPYREASEALAILYGVHWPACARAPLMVVDRQQQATLRTSDEFIGAPSTGLLRLRSYINEWDPIAVVELLELLDAYANRRN
jgi:hypothetical protein